MIRMIDLSKTLYPWTTAEEISALEAKKRDAYDFIQSSARAKASFMETYWAVRRCHKVVECDLYPKLEVVR